MGATPWRFKSSHPHSQITWCRGPHVAQTEELSGVTLAERIAQAETAGDKWTALVEHDNGRQEIHTWNQIGVRVEAINALDDESKELLRPRPSITTS